MLKNVRIFFVSFYPLRWFPTIKISSSGENTVQRFDNQGVKFGELFARPVSWPLPIYDPFLLERKKSR